MGARQPKIKVLLDSVSTEDPFPDGDLSPVTIPQRKGEGKTSFIKCEVGERQTVRPKLILI